MNLQSQENIFEQLKIDEGIKHECYLCSENVPTFGIGHKILKTDVEYGMPIGTEVDDERIWKVFKDDLVISINTLHNLFNFQLFDALNEMERVGKSNKYICVESYRNEVEKVNLLYWQVTCEGFYTPDEWNWWFNKSNYNGDHSFIYFE